MDEIYSEYTACKTPIPQSPGANLGDEITTSNMRCGVRGTNHGREIPRRAKMDFILISCICIAYLKVPCPSTFANHQVGLNLTELCF